MDRTDALPTFAPMGRRPRLDGDEQDAFSRSARRAGVMTPEGLAKTKALAARRSRRQTRVSLRGE